MKTIDGIFARRAREFPDKTAVNGHDGELEYAELEIRANQTAHHLQQLGVRPGDVVAVHAERSVAVAVMLLAVLKAGAAYLALDRRYPAENRRIILDDASVRVVLTQEHLETDLSDLDRTVVRIDRDWPQIAKQPSSAPSRMATPEDIAYVAYTSGSTGRPKGVCVPHRAVLRLVVDTDFMDISPDDVFLQFAPIAFDASTLEVWGPLLGGGRLAIGPPGDPTLGELITYVRQQRVSILWLTAGVFHRVVDAGLDDLRSLRYLVAGGDVLSVSHVNRALEALPGTAVINGYGPTENTTFTCCHTLLGLVRETTVPIGRPIRGTAVHILDHRLQVVPDGEAGELYATGLGLAHGYLSRPGLTAERFLADPRSPVPGGRMYRTGDMARQLPDGTLEFLGRGDEQVKIRGFRIEVGEVESALAGLHAVAEAAVVTQRQPSGERQLIAYVVVVPGADLSALEIRKRLGESLPSYAVPALVQLVEALPLTPNGKVDRTELAARGTPDRPEINALHRPPETPLEQAVAQLWTDHLGILGIGADDDFFELGGHSLLAVSLIAQLHKEYGVEISPLAFYLDPSPAGLARTIEKATAAL
ncbi:non-ribosomal peptide synthetase [Streptomyces sp. NBC_01262]|uniref:non-ribosomal peptide synthetase n=1 Tax=Streptomyces sp. NBC_01262 TaxID=2903803 RepID=UPI002E314FD9|nr:non-ribosomal peptide synthetase [Streptomyces sp. NBC_01262]